MNIKLLIKLIFIYKDIWIYIYKMDANQSLNTQDILDSIDINMINMNDKKKRGRPKKNNNIVNTNLTKIKLDNPSYNN